MSECYNCKKSIASAFKIDSSYTTINVIVGTSIDKLTTVYNISKFLCYICRASLIYTVNDAIKSRTLHNPSKISRMCISKETCDKLRKCPNGKTRVNMLYDILHKNKHVQYIGFSKMGLETIPKLNNLHLLTKINLSHNNLGVMPNMRELESLKVLDLSYNYIENVNGYVPYSLNWLNLKNNKIKYFEKPALTYHNLKYLNVSNNKLDKLPDDLSKSYVNLEELYFCGIRHIPDLGLYTELKKIVINENNYNIPDGVNKLNFKNLTNLEHVYIYMWVKDLQMINLGNAILLSSIKIRGKYSYDIFLDCGNVKNIDINKIYYGPVDVVKHLDSILNDNNLKLTNLNAINYHKELDCKEINDLLIKYEAPSDIMRMVSDN